MSNRYAIILTNDDGQEQVSDIKQMEGAPPQVPSGYKAVKVSDRVLIGMVKGGKKDAADGFGFPEGSDGAALRSAPGVTKVDEPPAAETAKAKTAKGKGAE